MKFFRCCSSVAHAKKFKEVLLSFLHKLLAIIVGGDDKQDGQ